MKKIMFNDRYGLTQAVIEGRKTVTRRIVSDKLWDRWTDYDDFCNSVSCGPSTPVVRQYYNEFEFFKDNLPYRIGEIVAVAQSYDQINPQIVHCRIDDLGDWGGDHPGQYNKMFVQADLMPHQIRITSVRPERLQDITDEDCLKEGVRFVENSDGYFSNGMSDEYTTPISAFAALIDEISGRRIWERNPFVWRIEFKLVK
jgi:hypothetical protein